MHLVKVAAEPLVGATEAASSKLRARSFRLSFDITATLFEEKEAMATRFDSVRKLFTAEGGKIDNFSLVSKMLDSVEAVHGGSSTEPGSRECHEALPLTLKEQKTLSLYH